ncbi:MAG: twin-arginine translocase TatA/TatE family subunit [Nitrospinaceae bacterium]|jgi:TatA/E family protein of Tat protein translocase|nr:twin-arginine translocase TatA/TatE family subunit [Nitrospinota bacterium]MDP6335688.1 twin-arginine translocase TatA/TatE family subunit [Nitrospinaceae bacterium]HAX47101.1 twin-arginine translocase TatA/TatE family subunit [Nitrospina sp.]MDP7147776.1 twin-arginine translocase TatA/TatE family subunit [Nitrospinaceae bacterium]MDP7557602.1 twin-arginine translocase TatA/TatE family subunit [Nitrospinaceae bacterium]|tara:strand:- start:235 stop:504 length:270 start_codon:yes stop_codon:yes gene_type:complete
MMGIGFPELMIILVIIMIIFGAGKLPEIGSAFGNSIKNFKKSMKEAEELQEAANLESSAIEEGTDNSAAEPSEEGTTEDTAPAQETNEK